MTVRYEGVTLGPPGGRKGAPGRARDLVATCPMSFWDEWLREGDLAGEPDSGTTYYWRTRQWNLMRRWARCHWRRDSRLYVVAHGRLRGWAPVVDVHVWNADREVAILRRGGATACTIPTGVPGFRGLRARWWPRSAEVPFPGWRIP